VMQVNGSDVTTGKQLQSLVSSMLPGDRAKLTLWRYDADLGAGKTVEIAVPLQRLDMLRRTGDLPPDQPRDSIIPLGIAKMATSTRELARQYNVAYTPAVMLLEY